MKLEIRKWKAWRIVHINHSKEFRLCRCIISTIEILVTIASVIHHPDQLLLVSIHKNNALFMDLYYDVFISIK